MAERLEQGPCIDHCAEKKGIYEIPGACSNCGTRYTLVIAKSHEVPGSMLGWRCPNCGCDRVGADRRPAEPLSVPEGRTEEQAVVGYSDSDLLRLYGEWSKDCYAASFMIPDDSSVRGFLDWLTWLTPERAANILTPAPREPYEIEMLRKVRAARSLSTPTEDNG